MFRCSLWNGVLALACLLLSECRGADVVMYDAVSGKIDGEQKGNWEMGD